MSCHRASTWPADIPQRRSARGIVSNNCFADQKEDQMKRHSFAVSLSLALLALLMLAGPAAAGEAVPFKGSLEGDVPHPPAPPFYSVLVEAAGNATHLGQFTVSIPHLVNTSTRTAAGTYIFTAANGDTLTADFIGHAAPSGTPGVLAIVEVATITGGTGRFEGATGSFTTERLFDTINLTTVGSFSGTISSPGEGN